MTEYKAFSGWNDVLAYVRLRGSIYYHAPMDQRPVLVTAQRRGNGRKVRIIPARAQADPFWADESHLDRMRYKVGSECQHYVDFYRRTCVYCGAFEPGGQS